jgi:hypothetical protein
VDTAFPPTAVNEIGEDAAWTPRSSASQFLRPISQRLHDCTRGATSYVLHASMGMATDPLHSSLYISSTLGEYTASALGREDRGTNQPRTVMLTIRLN